MSAPDKAAVLGQHAEYERSVMQAVLANAVDRDDLTSGEAIPDWIGVIATALIEARPILDAHFADRERAAAEKAWDEGYERRADAVASFLIRKTSAQVARHLTPPNPYRCTDKEADHG